MSVLNRDEKCAEYLPKLFALRKKGYSFPALAKIFRKNHATLLYHCHREGIYPDGYRGEIIKKYISPTLEKICPVCQKKFETKMLVKKYCSVDCKEKQYKNTIKLRPPKRYKDIKVTFGLDERGEKTNLGLDYKSYLLRQFKGNQKKVKKTLNLAKGWGTIETPRRPMKEIIAERKKAAEQRLSKLKT